MTSSHFTRAKRVAVAVMDVVSRRWLSTVVSAEETSAQIEVAFIAALTAEELAERIDARLLAWLRAGQTSPADLDGPDADRVPVLIAMSDNGPQMRSHSTREFMAATVRHRSLDCLVQACPGRLWTVKSSHLVWCPWTQRVDAPGRLRQRRAGEPPGTGSSPRRQT